VFLFLFIVFVFWYFACGVWLSGLNFVCGDADGLVDMRARSGEREQERCRPRPRKFVDVLFVMGGGEAAEERRRLRPRWGEGSCRRGRLLLGLGEWDMFGGWMAGWKLKGAVIVVVDGWTAGNGCER
jgi:hypothetical protein